MKLLLMPNNLNNITKYKDADGYIIGIKDLSWFVPLLTDKSNLEKDILKIKAINKQVFIAVNKLMYNDDIPLLKEYLLYIEKLNVDGILYSDLAVYNLCDELKLKTPLIWFSPHQFTNHFTANYWYDLGVKSGLLSTEITLDHIIKIKEQTKMKLMMYGYGYLPMFVSSRSLVSNYFKHINKKMNEKVYNMYEETRKSSYPTYEMGNDTIILSSSIINTIEELPVISNNIDYLILSSLNIRDEIFTLAYLNYIKALSNINNSDMLKEISGYVNNDSELKTDKGFLYKETVYRVKSNE